MAKTKAKYMMSDYPPWQVYRWTYNEETNVIERFDAEKKAWVLHDNSLLLGAFHHQVDAALSDIPAVSDADAMTLTTDGVTPEMQTKFNAAPTPY
jgi:YD repeat-containing protein